MRTLPVSPSPLPTVLPFQIKFSSASLLCHLLVLLLLLSSVSPGSFPANLQLINQHFLPLMSPLFHTYIDIPSPPSQVTKSQEDEIQSPSHLVPGNTLPTLLYTEPNSPSWLIFGQGGPHLRTYLPQFKGQRRPSCAARLKSSALLSTYGNAIFQVAFLCCSCLFHFQSRVGVLLWNFSDFLFQDTLDGSVIYSIFLNVRWCSYYSMSEHDDNCFTITITACVFFFFSTIWLNFAWLGLFYNHTHPSIMITSMMIMTIRMNKNQQIKL